MTCGKLQECRPSKFRFLCVVDPFSEVKQKETKQYTKGDAALAGGYDPPKCVSRFVRNAKCLCPSDGIGIRV